MAECRRHQPLAVFSGRSFDSAKSRMRSPVELPLLGQVSMEATVRPIDVQILRRMVVAVWPGKILEVHIPTAPLPMSGTGADDVEVLVVCY